MRPCWRSAAVERDSIPIESHGRYTLALRYAPGRGRALRPFFVNASIHRQSRADDSVRFGVMQMRRRRLDLVVLDVRVEDRADRRRESTHGSSRLRVLFLCAGNAARSQIAEALLRHLSKGQVDACSAGSVPAPIIHPAAKVVLEEKFGIDRTGLFPKSMNDFLADHFDVVITVCDRMAERCPSPAIPTAFIGASTIRRSNLHSTPSTGPVSTSANALAGRLRIWMSLPDIRRRLEAAP
jgi:protein-tyrosine-phosphatase